MANLITIDQLLESVDLDFEPRFVTKDENGTIYIWADKPEIEETIWDAPLSIHGKGFGKLKLSEFADKPWQECIYEVPRKTTGKIEKIFIPETDVCADSAEYSIELAKRLNQVIDAVNKHADIIQQIGDWGASKGECLWCEKLTSVNLGEIKCSFL